MLNDFRGDKNNEKIIEDFDKILENECNFKISDLMTINNSDTDEINKNKRNILNQTKISQPAILLHSILNFNKLQNEILNKNIPYHINCLFGPSLGEIIALVISGSINYDDGYKLLYNRGKCMQDSCPEGEGSMLNIVGEKEKNLNFFNNFINTLNDSERPFINISSFNSNRLFVVSGKTNLINLCQKYMKENSIATKKLPVSAAFHSKLMENGKKEFDTFLNKNSIKFKSLKWKIISTIDPVILKDDENDNKIKSLLIKQFTSPVNLLDCVSLIKNMDENILIYDIIKRKIINYSEFL